MNAFSQQVEWQPSEECPETEGEFLDVWLSMTGGNIIAGQVLRNPDALTEDETCMWFDEDRYLINPALVQYWMVRRAGDEAPESPL